MSQDSHQDQLAGATGQHYLSGLTRMARKDVNPNVADRFGLVSYLDLTTHEPPSHLKEAYDDISIVLRGLCGIVTSAVITNTGSDLEKRHDPGLWIDVFSKGLGGFFGGASEKAVAYSRQITGRQIAEMALKVFTGSTAERGTAFYRTFNSFLRRQGGEARVKAGAHRDGYRYGAVEMLHDITWSEKLGWIYQPEVRLIFTRFTKDTFDITSACRSREEFLFKFDVIQYSAKFKKDTWIGDPSFREKVKKFIKSYNKTDLSESKKYYRGVLADTPGSKNYNRDIFTSTSHVEA